MFGIRILKRRWVLGVIFFCSLIYFILNIQRKYPTLVADKPLLHSEKTKPRVEPDAIDWNSKDEEKINISSLATCRNSVQGKYLVTDDRGYVCERDNLLPGGCCNIAGEASKKFACNTCESNGCCQVYEFCVACCLQPEKQQLLRKILGQVSDQFQDIFASVTDQFELCLTKCRTSSQSVQHENSYRDSKSKYCYGEDPPEIKP